MQIFTDRTMAALQAGLTGEAQRQRVTADNVANINTPGYRAQKVEFEDSLARALGSRGSAGVTVSKTEATPWWSLNNNSVSLEGETATLVKSGLHYEAIVQAVNAKFGLLNTAIGVR